MLYNLKKSVLSVSLAVSSCLIVVDANAYENSNFLGSANGVVEYLFDVGTSGDVSATVNTAGFSPIIQVLLWSGTDATILDITSPNGTSGTYSDFLDAGSYSFLISQEGNAVNGGDTGLFTDAAGSAGTSFTAGGEEIADGEDEFDFALNSSSDTTLQNINKFDSLALKPDSEEQSQTTTVETTTETSLRAQTANTMNVVVSHFKQLRTGSNGEFAINNASYAPASGISAGDGVSGVALWFTPSYSSSNNTQTTSTATHYKERNLSYLVGLDYVLNTKTVIGAMAGYEDSTADLTNGGDTEKDGLVFSAYGAYNWSDQTTWYAQAGFGHPDNKIKDMSTGTAVTGEFDSKKAFFGLGALYSTQYNDYVVTLDGGFNWAKEDPDSYTNSSGNVIDAETTKIRLLNVNYEIAKPYGWGEGFFTAGLEYDTYNSSVTNSSLQGDDQLGGKLGAGLRFNATDNLFGEISANYNVMRTYQHGGHTIAATLRYTL